MASDFWAKPLGLPFSELTAPPALFLRRGSLVCAWPFFASAPSCVVSSFPRLSCLADDFSSQKVRLQLRDMLKPGSVALTVGLPGCILVARASMALHSLPNVPWWTHLSTQHRGFEGRYPGDMLTFGIGKSAFPATQAFFCSFVTLIPIMRHLRDWVMLNALLDLIARSPKQKIAAKGDMFTKKPLFDIQMSFGNCTMDQFAGPS